MTDLPPRLTEVADPGKYTFDDSLTMARQLIEAGRPLPEEIARLLQADPPPQDAIAERLFCLLETLTPPERLLPLLDRIMPSSSPRIRSKAWKLYTVASQDISWAHAQILDADARVAANVVEALWRAVPTEDLHQIFREAAIQDRNRVAANGLVGLFNFGDPLAAKLVHRLAHHAEWEFRASVAWAIGRAYWCGGYSLLCQLRKDKFEKVRINADRSLLRLQQRYPLLAA